MNIFNYPNMFNGRREIPGQAFNKLKATTTRIDVKDADKFSMRRFHADACGTKLGKPDATTYIGYLESYARYYFGSTDETVKNFGGFARLKNGGWIADVCNADAAIFNSSGETGDYGNNSDHVLFYNDGHGKMKAVILSDSGDASRVIISHDNTKKAGTINAVTLVTAIMYAIANMTANEEQQYSILVPFKNCLIAANYKTYDWNILIPIICDNMYYLSNDNDDILAEFLGLSDIHDLKDTFELLDKTSDIGEIISASIRGSLSGFENFENAKGYSYENVDVPHSNGKTTIGSLFGKYDPDPKRVRTPEEKAIIESAAYVDEMEASEEVCYMAEMIQKSSGMKHRMRNFILRGPAGTGKTTMVKQLSRLLNLPAVTFEMSPDTDKLDLTMSAIPAGAESETTSDNFESAEEWMKKLPNAVNWSFDPVGSYKAITGIDKPDANADDCEKAVLSLYSEKKQRESGKSGFTYVLSTIMKAIKNGWIVEVQEPTICSRPGVLASLNALSDDCQQVSLMNGEIVHRHMDAVMVYTTNTDYEGCYPLNQSQLSRFAIMTVELPNDEEIIARLEDASGLHDKDKLKRMVDVYNACKEMADQKGVTDGSIDFRALTDWAVAALITKRFYKSGLRMMIEKTTADPELQEQFVSCLDSQFMKNE